MQSNMYTHSYLLFIWNTQGQIEKSNFADTAFPAIKVVIYLDLDTCCVYKMPKVNKRSPHLGAIRKLHLQFLEIFNDPPA